jgi:hypothetical protein
MLPIFIYQWTDPANGETLPRRPTGWRCGGTDACRWLGSGARARPSSSARAVQHALTVALIDLARAERAGVVSGAAQGARARPGLLTGSVGGALDLGLAGPVGIRARCTRSAVAIVAEAARRIAAVHDRRAPFTKPRARPEHVSTSSVHCAQRHCLQSSVAVPASCRHSPSRVQLQSTVHRLPPSQSSPGSVTWLPQVAGQSVSLLAFAPVGQQPSSFTGVLIGVALHSTLQDWGAPLRTFTAQPLASAHVAGHAAAALLGSQVSPTSRRPLPQLSGSHPSGAPSSSRSAASSLPSQRSSRSQTPSPSVSIKCSGEHGSVAPASASMAPASIDPSPSLPASSGTAS